MSIEGILFCIMAGKADRARNAATAYPQGVVCCTDIAYGPLKKSHRLNVYCPEGADAPLPTILSIHGGGYVYGDKEAYHFYCADLARRGFAVVNFNYRLAPAFRFPAPLVDITGVLHWVAQHAGRYRLDPQRLFFVGDSAGAQLASQYAAILTNPDYAQLFSLRLPAVKLCGVGLNCGMYEPARTEHKGLLRDYLGPDVRADDPRLAVLGHITGAFPPAHITTAYHDFLHDEAEPMCALLREKGVDAVWQCYGAPDRQDIGHVFHVDIRTPEAMACNDAQCDFFRAHLPA